MALLQKGIAAATSRMPRMISPRTHAMVDYSNMALFAALGVLFRKRNQRAAFAAFAIGAVEAVTVFTTDYPGGIAGLIDFSTHGTIDMGVSAALFAIPGMLRFQDSPEAKYFHWMSLGLTAITGLTDFER
jgi:hypothetical protein